MEVIALAIEGFALGGISYDGNGPKGVVVDGKYSEG